MSYDVKLNNRQCLAIASVLLVIIITVLDVFVINVALPVMADSLYISDSQSVWIVTVYQLAIIMLMLPLASLGDIYGYRKIMLIGVGIFVFASGLCALSGNFASLLLSRGLQGIGASCIMAVDIAMVRLIYPKEIFGRGIALNAMVIAVSTAAAPTIAGLILSEASWHWLFLINIPLGAAAVLMGYRTLPANPFEVKENSFDWLGSLENMVVFGLLFYGIGSIVQKGHLLTSLILLAVGLILGLHLYKRESRRTHPLLPVDLFGIRQYSLSIVTYVFSFIAQSLTMVSLPFLFLSGMNFGEVATGLLMTPWPIATMITAPVSARLAERIKPGKLAAAGMLVFVIGAIWLIIGSSHGMSEIDITVRMAICGIGFGLFQTPNNIVMIQSTPLSRSGAAGGMQGTARLVGQAFGATLVTIIFALTKESVTVAVENCLIIAVACGLAASVFSASRKGIACK